MKNIAIIAEYNPFHNGHKYHLNQAKEISGSDFCVALMSGNFLQRGIPAMWDKYTRAKMATSSGIDLALELPFVYATGSARDFATGSIKILDKLHSIDYLCFGAETDDINTLYKIADVINSEPDSYKHTLTDCLSMGLSYPHARSKALTTYLNLKDDNIINQPNNILAIEYIAAISRINSNIKPIIIKRHNAMYHDTTLYRSISSASAIRSTINSIDFDIEKIKDDIPDNVLRILQQGYNSSWPVTSDDLTPFLQGCLINAIDYDGICDISEDFSNKLCKLSPTISYQDAINSLSSKDLTATRINRCLIHLIMNYKEIHRQQFIDNNYAFYASILSFRKESSQLIKTINQQSDIPLITKKADYEKYINSYPDIPYNIASTMWQYDIKATSLYNCLVYNRFNQIQPNDYNIQLPII